VRRIKILELCAVDVTARFILLPLVERLRREGFEVHVGCSPGRHLDYLRGLGLEVRPVAIARRVASPRHVLSLIRLTRLMRRERYDVVHVHTPVAAALGRVAARLAGVPVVIYTAHGFYFHDRMPPWKRSLIAFVERALFRLGTTALFTVSAEDRETAVAKRIAPAAKVVWIGNGVDVVRFRPQDGSALRKELGLRPEDRVVGFVGRLVPEKGFWELLRAMALVQRQHPKAKLLIVGETLKSDRARSETASATRFILEEGLTEAVRCVGFQDDVAPYLSAMDLFVLPSHREGLPLTILEAMASGLPVVATNIRGCREEVIDGVTGRLVPVEDAASLAEAISGILSDEEQRLRMGLAARDRATREFDLEKALDRQIAAIRALLGD